eukprot:Filipodium_phascolosomae@DN198_c0_g1_i1.p1
MPFLSASFEELSGEPPRLEVRGPLKFQLFEKLLEIVTLTSDHVLSLSSVKLVAFPNTENERCTPSNFVLEFFFKSTKSSCSESLRLMVDKIERLAAEILIQEKRTTGSPNIANTDIYMEVPLPQNIEVLVRCFGGGPLLVETARCFSMYGFIVRSANIIIKPDGVARQCYLLGCVYLMQKLHEYKGVSDGQIVQSLESGLLAHLTEKMSEGQPLLSASPAPRGSGFLSRDSRFTTNFTSRSGSTTVMEQIRVPPNVIKSNSQKKQGSVESSKLAVPPVVVTVRLEPKGVLSRSISKWSRYAFFHFKGLAQITPAVGRQKTSRPSLSRQQSPTARV